MSDPHHRSGRPELFPSLTPAERADFDECMQAIARATSLLRSAGVQRATCTAALLASAYQCACDGVPLHEHGCVDHHVSIAALGCAHDRQHIRGWMLAQRGGANG